MKVNKRRTLGGKTFAADESVHFFVNFVRLEIQSIYRDGNFFFHHHSVR